MEAQSGGQQAQWDGNGGADYRMSGEKGPRGDGRRRQADGMAEQRPELRETCMGVEA